MFVLIKSDTSITLDNLAARCWHDASFNTAMDSVRVRDLFLGGTLRWSGRGSKIHQTFTDLSFSPSILEPARARAIALHMKMLFH